MTQAARATAKTRVVRPSNGDRNTVQSVHRAVALLDLLGASRAVTSVTELAKTARLDRTVTHRLLRTLRMHDLIQERNGRYALGNHMLVWGSACLDQLPVRRAALPYAVDLQNRVLSGKPWIVSVGVPAGDVAVLVLAIWSPGVPLDSIMDIGSLLPMTRSAIGRAILAYTSPSERSDTIDVQLRNRLRAIRDAHGVEFSSDEIRQGISAVAATILAHGEEPAGAIAVSGPDLHSELSRTSPLSEHLRRAADRIGLTLP